VEVPRLHQVAQRAVDFDRPVAFYRDVIGLRHLASFNPPGLAFFDLGSSRLLFDVNAPSALLYLEVDDVTLRTEQLRARGVTIETEPHVIFVDDAGLFGPVGDVEMMSFFRDSEDNVVALASRAPSPPEG